MYDFKLPPNPIGHAWEQIDVHWKLWTPEQFRDALSHPRASMCFRQDMDALSRCDACVCVLPCGRSAHLELGWAAGAGKITCVLLAPDSTVECALCAGKDGADDHTAGCAVLPQRSAEPELMYKMLGPDSAWMHGNALRAVCLTLDEVSSFLGGPPPMTEAQAWRQLALARGATSSARRFGEGVQEAASLPRVGAMSEHVERAFHAERAALAALRRLGVLDEIGVLR